ncbi:hypothetical protein R3P38DRAFT_3588444 [Favolaschia claudopus]|uniref:Uncharacterized protein n=1 Tax=Favolaschia claudopus TaxID=2862362 RepID=A0AAW0AIB5_9AGAR
MDPIPTSSQSFSHHNAPLVSEDVDMPDAIPLTALAAGTPETGYLRVVVGQQPPVATERSAQRPLLPPIDTDLDFQLHSFDNLHRSPSSDSNSVLSRPTPDHQSHAESSYQGDTRSVYSPSLSNVSFPPASPRFQPTHTTPNTSQLPSPVDVPPQSPVSSSTSTSFHTPVTLSTKSALLAEYNAGRIKSRANTVGGTYELECPQCSTWINSNVVLTRTLMIEGQFNTLFQHMKGRACQANIARSRSQSQSPVLSRRASLASISMPDSPASGSSSPNLRRGAPLVPPPSPFMLENSHSLSRSDLLPTNLSRRQSSASLPFSPRPAVSPLPAAAMPLPFASFSYDNRYDQSQRTVQDPPERPPSMSIPSAPAANECPGVVVDWPLQLDLKFNETFPFHRLPLGRSLGDLPFFIEIREEGEKIVAWSKSCTRRPNPFTSCCSECHKITSRISKLADIAAHAEKGTNYKFLNYAQLEDLLTKRNKENNDLKLRSLNMSRQLATFARKMGDYERFVMAIAENDVPRVNALLSTALRNGASINTIVSQILESVQGLRSTKGFTDFELDLSTLVFRVGGNSLLYALNHALGLPSLRTINNSTNFVKITPTFGHNNVIKENIRKVILEQRGLSGKMQKRGGVVVMMDEVALEEHLDYFPKEKQNRRLSVYTIVDKLRAEEVHFGKEMAVVAVRFAHEKDIYPILLYPTCKTETVEDMQQIYAFIMQAWEELGAPIFGDIRNFATDGDNLRRQVGYKMFCAEKLPETHPLFAILSNLPGLNLYTGLKLILQTFDWRHIIKRESTLVRQPSGMCVQDRQVVNPHFLAQCLDLIEKHDEKSIHKLLNPDDPQDVPRAIDLIEAIISVRDITPLSHNVDLTSTCDSVRLLGHVLENFMSPFISPEFSLSKQICTLSTCAHLIFVLFREYRLDFKSNQLYGDTQSTIKNIVFSVAKQQLEDSQVDANANEDGTDPLEGHFSFMRTIGGHNSAMSYKQAVERSGLACDIQGVYGRWPHLHQESRRRRITRTEQKDHLNSHKWNADLKAGNCDLIEEWATGRINAVLILRASEKLSTDAYDFERILADSDVDFLRPWGRNYYPGVALDNDRSIEQPTSNPRPDAQPPSNSVPHPASSIPLDVEVEADADSDEDSPEPETVDPEPITLFDLIDDEPDRIFPMALELIPITTSGQRTLLYQGRVEIVEGKRDGKYDGISVHSRGSIPRPRSAWQDCLNGWVKSTSIIQDGRSVRDVVAGTIGNPQANIKLVGQIMHLEAVRTTPDDILDGESMEEGWTWLSTGAFLTKTSKMQATGILTTKPVIVTVPGILVELVNPTVVDARGRLSEQAAKGLNSAGTGWALRNSSLDFLLAKLSQSLSDTTAGLRAIPKVGESVHFPYKLPQGQVALKSESGTALVATNPAQRCLYCPEVPKNWRAHIGAHILRHLRGSGEPKAKKNTPGENSASVAQIHDSMPCGLCGRSGRPECEVTMKPNSKKSDSDMKTDCQYYTQFQYKTADEGKSKGSCRNVPIICGLCPGPARQHDTVPGIWRYNMPEHLRMHHAEYASPQQPEGLPLPYSVWKSMEISQEEKAAMGVRPEFILQPFTQVASAAAGGETLKRASESSGGIAKRGRR